MAVKVDKLRGLLCIKRIDRVPNARIRELCGIAEWVDDRIDERTDVGLVVLKGWGTIGLL